MENEPWFTINVVARKIYNIQYAHDELRQLDRMEQDPAVQKVIVFDLSSEQAYKHILRQVQWLRLYIFCTPNTMYNKIWLK